VRSVILISLPFLRFTGGLNVLFQVFVPTVLKPEEMAIDENQASKLLTKETTNVLIDVNICCRRMP
jgi:hypothetical protein